MTTPATRFVPVDLARLPAPQVIEPLDFEAEFDALRARLVAADPTLAPALALESEPAVKVLQLWVYELMRTRARINDAARACLLAHATGADLDNLAALLGVTRAQTTTAEGQPPVPEEDTRLRERTRLALQAFSNAGPAGAYRYWALTADPSVRDAHVDSPAPGEVRVTVLPADPDAVATDLLAAVAAVVTSDEVRVLTDGVVVEVATAIPFEVEAQLQPSSAGPGGTVVLAAAETALTNYLDSRKGLGRRISRSGLLAALHVPGVETVVLQAPAADVTPLPTQFAQATSRSVTLLALDTEEAAP